MQFNRRQLPRVQVNIPAKVILSGGLQLDVMVKDFSSQNIQLQCSSAAQSVLFPYGASGSPEQAVRVGLYMILPDVEPTEPPVKAVCEVSVCRRLSVHHYAIIMSYRNVDPLSIQSLTHFIHKQLTPTLSLETG